jgi:hypothetical protein
MCDQLEEENAKLRECTLDIKESLRYLKEINNSFKIKITKLRNSKEECKRCDSLIKEVINLRETLEKFTQGKKKLELILSSQRSSINKNGLGLKKERKTRNNIYHKVKKRPMYR